WTGGHGAKPSETGYVGPSGLTSDIAQATDVRGPEGPNGPGTGDMLKTQYDPQGIEGDAFSMANFTGRPKWYPRDLSSLLADTSLGYAAGDPAGIVQAGDVIQTQAENFRFEVAASD